MTIDYTLKHGSHESREAGLCAMEWTAYLAGEEHSDSPKCVDPPLRRFAMSLNDQWDDEQRQKLRPYLVRCIGTAGDGRTEERGWLAMDWLIREFTPAFLDLRPELAHHADALRKLAEVRTHETLSGAMGALTEAQKDAAAARDAARDAARAAARDAAWDAAWAAAGAAAWDAARDAARAAAWDAARDAARAAAGAAAWDAAGAAARDAAGAAAGAAAWDAAGDAAWDAAGDALAPTVARLQDSALDLFDRMIGQGEVIDLPEPMACEYKRLIEA